MPRLFFCNVPELSRVSRKNFQVSRLPEKFLDSRNHFGFVSKQRSLELSPPVVINVLRRLYFYFCLKRLTFHDINTVITLMCISCYSGNNHYEIAHFKET